MLPELEMTKTYHKDPKSGEKNKGFGKPATAWRLTDSQGKNYWIQPHRHNISPNLPMGVRMAVKVFGGKVVKARCLEEENN